MMQFTKKVEILEINPKRKIITTFKLKIQSNYFNDKLSELQNKSWFIGARKT